MISDYHQHVESSFCNHSNQYLPYRGQGQVLETDIDLLLMNQSQLCDTLRKFEKQSVLSDHNLHNFKKNNVQSDQGQDFRCYGDQGFRCYGDSLHSLGRADFRSTSSCHSQTSDNDIGYRRNAGHNMQSQGNVHQGSCIKGLDLQNDLDPRGFDVNAWYNNYYTEEAMTWNREGSLAATEGRFSQGSIHGNTWWVIISHNANSTGQ